MIGRLLRFETPWVKKTVGGLSLYQARILGWMPGVAQGFTTRAGGVSRAPYEGLNLAAHVGDALGDVQENRRRVWDGLGSAEGDVAMAEQVHGDGIARVTAGGLSFGADALISDTPGLLLMLFYADCAPVYLYDPARRALGLVHAGWRGTAANLAAKTVAAMREAFGSRPGELLAAVGPCIGAESYEVGGEVADRFRPYGGSAVAVLPKNEMGGKYSLNLRQVLFTQLLAAGVRAESIAICDEDTARNRRDFFSYRRDGAASGRMAAVLGLRPPKENL